MERTRIRRREQQLERREWLDLQNFREHAGGDMKVRRHERIVRGSKPPLPRRIRKIVGGVIGRPRTIDLARQTQVIDLTDARDAQPRADATADERTPVRLDERPAVLVSAVTHLAMQLIREPRSQSQLHSIKLKIRNGFHARVAASAGLAAVARESHARISDEQNAIALIPRQIENVMQRAIESFVTRAEMFELRRRFGLAVHLAEPAAKLAQDRLIGQHRIRQET